MFLDVNINNRVSTKVSIVSVAELRAIQKGTRIIKQEAYVKSRIAEAEAMTADSWANEPEDVFCKDYYYDEATDSILYTDTTFYSAYHWSIKAKWAAGGLTYVGQWDASSGTYPPNGTVTGEFYIISVIGTIDNQQYNVGDWLIWDDVSQSWDGVHWKFSWSTISDVTVDGNAPVNGDNLASVSYVDTGLTAIQDELDQLKEDLRAQCIPIVLSN
jgi:hypothetical protein